MSQSAVDADLLACGFLEGRDHLDALPWPGPVDLVLFTGLRVECGLVRALNLEDELRDHLLRHLDDVVVVRVRPDVWSIRYVHRLGALNEHIEFYRLVSQLSQPESAEVVAGRIYRKFRVVG